VLNNSGKCLHGAPRPACQAEDRKRRASRRYFLPERFAVANLEAVRRRVELGMQMLQLASSP
jgi:hypothetical protein